MKFFNWVVVAPAIMFGIYVVAIDVFGSPEGFADIYSPMSELQVYIDQRLAPTSKH